MFFHAILSMVNAERSALEGKQRILHAGSSVPASQQTVNWRVGLVT